MPDSQSCCLRDKLIHNGGRLRFLIAPPLTLKFADMASNVSLTLEHVNRLLKQSFFPPAYTLA